MKIYWQHVALILGLAAIAATALVFIPEHFYDKAGSALALVAADPVGTAAAATVIGTTLGTFIAFYRRALYTPPPSGTGTTTTSSTGEPRS
jgi:hypothetical protein